MAISACVNGAVLTALLALFLLPAEYLLPRAHREPRGSQPRPPPGAPTGPSSPLDLPAAGDLFLAGCLLLAVLCAYPCDWIQRKLLERRIQKLKQQASESADVVRASEARARQAEGALRTAQAATTEYNLLLYLLLRHHQLGPSARSPSHDCLYRNEPDDVGLLAHPDGGYGRTAL